MLTKCLLLLVGAGSAAVALGCSSSGAGPDPGDDGATIAPAGLDVSLEPGGAGVLDLVGLTLRDGPGGLELYAALKNDGDVPACDAAFKVTLYDRAAQPLGSWINGLHTTHFFRYALPDGSSTIAACASPGDVTMAQLFTMADDVAADDVGQVVYYYSYFALDAVPVDGLTVSGVNAVRTGGGTSYTGTIVNGLDLTASSPSVTVFALNRTGRPLAATSSAGSGPIPPGGSWTFQTDVADAQGAGFAAYPAASFGD
ncbi:MAG TPA: FxLYD domain-containing protein [Polyangia bacterium]|nr:FxLYD domain-containing protein [Polyangia bacterium]